MQGENFQIDKEPILSIPLKLPTKVEQDRLARVVKKIIDCKKEIEKLKTESQLAQMKRYILQFEQQLNAEIEKIYELEESECFLLD